MTFPELLYKWFSDDPELSEKFCMIYHPDRDYCSVVSKNNIVEYAYACSDFNAYAKLIDDNKTHYFGNTAGLWIHGNGMLLPSDLEFFNKAKNILLNEIKPVMTYIFAPYITLQTPQI